MAHRICETSGKTPGHRSISGITSKIRQGHNRFFLFQLKNFPVEKKKWLILEAVNVL